VIVRRVARRLAWAVVVVWAVATLVFVIQHALPSDPARLVAGPQARPGDVAAIRATMGIDRPMHVQYARFAGRLIHWRRGGDHATCGAVLGDLHVDLGKSYQQGRPVLTVVGERLPRSLLLAVAAVLVQCLLGVAAGAFAAKRRGSWLDAGTVSVALVAASAPTFLTGLLLQWVFAHRLRVLPLDGYGRTAAEHAAALVLPALTLGLFGAAFYTRLVRDEVLGALALDHVRTARAKGVSPWGVLVKHALRNAMLPLVTVIGLDLGALVGGAVVTEQLFRWPGLGSLGVTAILDRDAPLVMGVVLVTSTAIVLASIVVDGVYATLDPRVRR